MGRKRATEDDRIFTLESVLFSLCAIMIGAVLVAVSEIPAIRDVEWLPLKELGFTAIGSGVVAAWFEYRAGRGWISRIIAANIRGLSAQPADLARLLSPHAVDGIATNSLGLRFGNKDLAAHMVGDMTAQVEHSQGRLRYDARVSIAVTPWDGHTDTEADSSFYIPSVRCLHRTEAPLGEPQIFRCVPDSHRYEELLGDPATAVEARFAPHAGLSADSPEVFSLRHYAINGVPQPIARQARDGEQTFTVTPSPEAAVAGQLYTVEYEYQRLISREHYGMRYDIDTITRGLSIEFTTYDPAIGHVEPIIAVPGHRPIRPSVSCNGDTITIDHWIMPVTTASFIWTRAATEAD
jgi:hypothetical protein